jgi:uncharacterized damage-inducible protein DinB
MDKSHIAANDAERERLKQLIARLSDEQLSHPMPAGWTVASVLAHMAYWDARALALMNAWETGAVPSKADFEPEGDWLNDSVKPLCLALAPRAAAQLAIQLAEETDAKVAALTDARLEQIMAVGQPFALSRAGHRGEHIDEIESILR